MKVLPYATLAVICLIVFGEAHAGRPRGIAASGEVAGTTIHATVDSELARYFLEEYTRGRGTNESYNRRLDQLVHGSLEPSSTISAQTSPDLAALLFARAVSEQNHAVQSLYARHVAELRTGNPQLLQQIREHASRYTILFVPGWFYQTHPETGADFQRQLVALREAGIDARLLPTGDNASVEENASRIAAAIRHLSRHRQLLVVSTSKSGPEVALALGTMLSASEARPVRAWINTGGVLLGSPLADSAVRIPRRWLTGVLLRRKCEGVVSMTPTVRRHAAQRIRIPGNVLGINYLGVPLSGTVSARARSGYERLRPLGPNDGLTLLADALLPGAPTILEIGLDHYFVTPDAEVRAVALLATTLDLLELQIARPMR